MAQPVATATPAPVPRVRLIYDVEAHTERFLLDEDDMPESPLHDQVLDLLKLLLLAWVARAGRDAFVARNLACRWDPSDARIGLDPDLCIIEPPPPDLDTLTQLRLWEPGHAAPWLGVEVVSRSTASKDYLDAPVRYARAGVRELWVFDPLREGPTETGGPFVLQLWRREGEQMRRVYAGDGPARSPELGAWLVVTEGGRRLRVADDEAGARLWPTEAEAAERARAASEAARAEAEREVAELRRRLSELEAGARTT